MMFNRLSVYLSVFALFKVVQAQPDANFRRDYYLEQKDYPEGDWAPIPKEGGRVQFISDVASNLTLIKPLMVDFGGFQMKLAPIDYPDDVPVNGLDWCHSQYNEVSGTLFTSFHIHTDDLLKSISKLVVTDADGQVIVDTKASVDVDNTPDVQVTYVTTKSNFQQLVLHIHNYAKEQRKVKGISINTGSISYGDAFTLQAGEHAIRILDVSSLGFREAAVWTVSITYNDEDDEEHVAGYGGRLNKELFPIEDWPKSSQCPFPVPGANEDNFDTLQEDLSINTHFLGGSCDASASDVITAAAESNGSWYVLPSESYWLEEPLDYIDDSTYRGIAAAFLGDESDGSLEKSWDVWNRALTAQENYDNKFALYDGGHSNHLNGAFSGVVDIQGMDFYVAACAPHITMWTSTMRIQGSFDYLYNARQNHKPLTTWMYSQGWCSDCWSVKDLYAGEILVQLASVVAAGAKGLMLFESDLQLQGSESWDAGSKFLKSVQLLSDWLRLSDPEGALFETSAKTKNDLILQVLGGPEGLLVVMINTKASGYNDKTCAVSGRHWSFDEQTVDSTVVTLPPDLVQAATASGKSLSEYYQVVEVSKGKFDDDPDDAKLEIDDSEGTWELKDVKLGSSSTVVRMFYLTVKK